MERSNLAVFTIRPYTKKELRLLYNVPLSTYKRWLRAIPEVRLSGSKNWLTISQVLAIITKYGAPGGLPPAYANQSSTQTVQ